MNIKFKNNKDIIDEINVTVEYSCINNEVSELISHIKNYESKDYIVINVDKAHLIIKKTDIVYIEVNVDMISLKTINDLYQFRYRLYKILEDINSARFIQVSKYCIINMDYLSKIETSFSGNMYAILKNDIKVNVSRTYYRNLKQYLNI